MGDREPTTGQWIDIDDALAHAEQIHREAGMLVRILTDGREWWDRMDQRNGFADRWARATGRSA